MRRFHALASVLVPGLALSTLGALPAGAASPSKVTTPVTFTLGAHVQDGGQQVTSVTLHTAGLRINPASLTVNSFRVHATGTNPYTTLAASTVVGTYDLDRTITRVRLDRSGNVVISMVSGPDAPGAYTFAYSLTEQRNLMLKLRYTVTERLPITLRSGKRVTLTTMTQGRVVDPEVDAYRAGASADGLKYRLFVPRNASAGNQRPLVVWLHGGGEGGWAKAYDGTLPLIANRGALGFSTPAAQRIFRGAYVVAPQANTRWLDNPTMHYAPRIKALIDQLAMRYHVNRKRIYVVGASNGGYMTLQMVSDYPKLFAADVPVCPALVFNDHRMLTDAQLRRLTGTPTWVVQAKNDPVLPFAANGAVVHRVVTNSLLTAYPDVTWNGHTYAGHWSWIYVARNNPVTPAGTHLFQWMSAKHR